MNVSVTRTVPGFMWALALAALSAPAAHARTTPAPAASMIDTTATPSVDPAIRPDLTLVDPKGTVLGKIEHLLTGPDGGVRQVLVRTGGVARVRSSLKALPAAGLTPRGGEAVASLTREELQALPDATAPETPAAP
jgi:hypothetical protein